MQSSLYRGWVRHRRLDAAQHEFRYRLCLLYLDLAELPAALDGYWLWSARRPALARWHREDHHGDALEPLDEAIRNLVEARSGQRPRGPIRLLTQPRYFGYGFNPVSFYYCYDADGVTLEAIVAEINNTPWGEQHCYVLSGAEAVGDAGIRRYALGKQMHVSPFMPMDIDYDWRFSEPGPALSVHMQNLRDGGKIFDATLALTRTEITGASLARVLVTYPWMTARVIFAIHWQALKLWLKRVPFYVHPAKEAPASANPE
jgi:hypothetical protein